MNSWVVFDRDSGRIVFEAEGLAGRILCAAYVATEGEGRDWAVKQYDNVSGEAQQNWHAHWVMSCGTHDTFVHGEMWEDLGEDQETVYDEWVARLGLAGVKA